MSTENNYNVDVNDLLKMSFSIAHRGERYLGTNRFGERERVRKYSDSADIIVDVGCGRNAWKRIYKDKLIGIDLHGGGADIVGDMTEELNKMDEESVDVILNMGGINFGNDTTIIEQVTACHRVLKPKGHLLMRGHYHLRKTDAPVVEGGDSHTLHYSWNMEKVKYLTTLFNWTIVEGPENLTPTDPDVLAARGHSKGSATLISAMNRAERKKLTEGHKQRLLLKDNDPMEVVNRTYQKRWWVWQK